ncbi:unnamed protein product [Adineta steineri]|uniref:Uncharacterized protein n=1 Tax=Adineta steineri TaxID=433720 RepID=A0A813VVK8_9BILA|nr:unnamed protein product [Adineta steineri]CAF0920727.1 unnamed protein product [Adineta steineri]
MSSAVLRGTINLVSSVYPLNTSPSFDYGETLCLYVEDRSQVPKTEHAQKYPRYNGSIMLGRKAINLTQDTKFPLEFQCEYDPTKASNNRFDKLCKEGFITVGAEIIDGRGDMTIYWVVGPDPKFEQNIKLTLFN